jgi:hypothetical protein
MLSDKELRDLVVRARTIVRGQNGNGGLGAATNAVAPMSEGPVIAAVFTALVEQEPKA